MLSYVFVVCDDKGVKIDRDSHGNIYLTNLSDCEVIVKGFQHPESHCIADDVVQTSGRVGSEKTKVLRLLWCLITVPKSEQQFFGNLVVKCAKIIFRI